MLRNDQYVIGGSILEASETGRKNIEERENHQHSQYDHKSCKRPAHKRSLPSSPDRPLRTFNLDSSRCIKRCIYLHQNRPSSPRSLTTLFVSKIKAVPTTALTRPRAVVSPH